MSSDVVIAVCIGAGVCLLVQKNIVAIAVLCVLALAYIMLQTKEISTPSSKMEYTTHINTPFEMDVVEQDADDTQDAQKDTWHEWNKKLADSSHIQRWLNMFGTQNDFDGFHLI